MIKKIICPTDFSDSAYNAAEYAAKFARLFNAELLFVNVQRFIPEAAAVSLGEGIGINVRENSRIAMKRLKEMSIEANKMFKISTDYEVDITAKSMSKIVSSLGTDNVMIIMGTNGVDSVYQYFFGTNTYSVVKKARCPVLIIPESISYGSIRKVVFVLDTIFKSKLSFSLVNEIMKIFNPEFTFLSINKYKSPLGHDGYKTLHDEIKSVLGETPNVRFEQITGDNASETINDYMIRTKADMLAIVFYNRGIMRDVFQGKVERELSEVAQYPVLVLQA